MPSNMPCTQDYVHINTRTQLKTGIDGYYLYCYSD